METVRRSAARAGWPVQAPRPPPPIRPPRSAAGARMVHHGPDLDIRLRLESRERCRRSRRRAGRRCREPVSKALSDPMSGRRRRDVPCRAEACLRIPAARQLGHPCTGRRSLARRCLARPHTRRRPLQSAGSRRIAPSRVRTGATIRPTRRPRRTVRRGNAATRTARRRTGRPTRHAPSHARRRQIPAAVRPAPTVPVPAPSEARPHHQVRRHLRPLPRVHPEDRHRPVPTETEEDPDRAGEARSQEGRCQGEGGGNDQGAKVPECQGARVPGC
jgi:hypothetical protein